MWATVFIMKLIHLTILLSLMCGLQAQTASVSSSIRILKELLDSSTGSEPDTPMMGFYRTMVRQFTSILSEFLKVMNEEPGKAFLRTEGLLAQESSSYNNNIHQHVFGRDGVCACGKRNHNLQHFSLPQGSFRIQHFLECNSVYFRNQTSAAGSAGGKVE